MQHILIGIDDTDNLNSRGTGYQARTLGNHLVENDYITLKSVTRHQLFFDPRIPYTSHNSSACLSVEAKTDINNIIDYCGDYLKKHAADGSDAGLCIVEYDKVNQELISYGLRAKKEIINIKEAELLAAQYNISLTAHSGSGIGIIGALAAVSLHKSGNDGRFLWLPGLRETKAGNYMIKDLLEQTSIDRCQTMDGKTVEDISKKITIGDWTKPVFLDNKSTLLVEEVDSNGESFWHALPKNIVKQY